MRMLTIDDAARAKIAAVLAHAEAHHYCPPYGTLPGDDPRFVAHLDTFRAVFSYTHADGVVWRHLSLSVPGRKYPHPFAAYTIAQMFGFTGWDGRTVEPSPEDWGIDIHKLEHCIVMAQAVRAEISKAEAN